MVSRQETARQLLTPGEVMQLSPDEELLLVAGLAPIRAHKLRYFADRNFTPRVCPAPILNDGPYIDRPAGRSIDWVDSTRAVDVRLDVPAEAEGADDDGGMQQQRHPGLAEQTTERPEAMVQDQDRDTAEDGDPVAEQRAMDQARGLNPVIRGHALNEGSHHDLVPGM